MDKFESAEQFQETLSEHGYEYKRNLGTGAFSTVFLCHRKKYSQDFAVKRTIRHGVTEFEYNAMVSLHHPNIVQLYDSFNDDSAHYLVMEYCPNGTLIDKGILSYEKFIFYAKQILEALSFCHSLNIAHRDIKPDNIFIDQYDHIKLADFGMANIFHNNCKTSEKCGSFCYVAPEMFRFREIDPFKADIWALGITFFYMVTGTVPFTFVSKDDLKEKILFGELDFYLYDFDPEICFLIRKMTEKNVKLRPTAEKLLKFPIFQSSYIRKSAMSRILKKPLTVYRTKPKIRAHQSLAINVNTDTQNNDENGKVRRVINSYKSVTFVSGTQRNKNRFQFVKDAL
ncbi:hypothetical protein M9Y10_006211 [Tritrichomonas musculus]|uniref:Protein kinase domain-containing protein n=1 Tax=Tritrichomonas musculus TaxID=1915356 RepID=A0ABR2JDK5_9EUKA